MRADKIVSKDRKGEGHVLHSLPSHLFLFLPLLLPPSFSPPLPFSKTGSHHAAQAGVRHVPLLNISSAKITGMDHTEELSYLRTSFGNSPLPSLYFPSLPLISLPTSFSHPFHCCSNSPSFFPPLASVLLWLLLLLPGTTSSRWISPTHPAATPTPASEPHPCPCSSSFAGHSTLLHFLSWKSSRGGPAVVRAVTTGSGRTRGRESSSSELLHSRLLVLPCRILSDFLPFVPQFPPL